MLGLLALQGQGQDTLIDLLSDERRSAAVEILIDGKERRFRYLADAFPFGVRLVIVDS